MGDLRMQPQQMASRKSAEGVVAWAQHVMSDLGPVADCSNQVVSNLDNLLEAVALLC